MLKIFSLLIFFLLNFCAPHEVYRHPLLGTIDAVVFTAPYPRTVDAVRRLYPSLGLLAAQRPLRTLQLRARRVHHFDQQNLAYPAVGGLLKLVETDEGFVSLSSGFLPHEAATLWLSAREAPLLALHTRSAAEAHLSAHFEHVAERFECPEARASRRFHHYGGEVVLVVEHLCTPLGGVHSASDPMSDDLNTESTESKASRLARDSYKVRVDAGSGEVLEGGLARPHALERAVQRLDRYRDDDLVVGAVEWSQGDAYPTGVAPVDTALNYSQYMYTTFSNGFGLDGWDGEGGAFISNYWLPPLLGGDALCPNAFFFDGQIYFCDGLLVADVTFHEWGHAYVDTLGGLDYFAQSGALNEAYADAFAETLQQLWAIPEAYGARATPPGEASDCVDFFAQPPQSRRWIVGDQSDAAFTDGLRDMWAPGCKGQPGVLGGEGYYCGDGDNRGVHTNSGVFNQLYAVLAEGGVLNGVDVNGVGLLKAFALIVEAAVAFNTPTTDFGGIGRNLALSCQALLGAELLDPRTGLALNITLTAADCDAVPVVLAAVGIDGNVTAPCGSAYNVSYPFGESPTLSYYALGPLNSLQATETTVDQALYLASSRETAQDATCDLLDRKTGTSYPMTVLGGRGSQVLRCQYPDRSEPRTAMTVVPRVSGHLTDHQVVWRAHLGVGDVTPLEGKRGDTVYLAPSKASDAFFDPNVPAVCDYFSIEEDHFGKFYSCFVCRFGADGGAEMLFSKAYLNADGSVECQAPADYLAQDVALSFDGFEFFRANVTVVPTTTESTSSSSSTSSTSGGDSGGDGGAAGAVTAGVVLLWVFGICCCLFCCVLLVVVIVGLVAGVFVFYKRKQNQYSEL